MIQINDKSNLPLLCAIIMFVVGILFCCSLLVGITALSIIIGILLILSGVMFVINCIVNSNTVFSVDGLLGMSLVALGIVVLANNLAGIIFLFIPWMLIVFGMGCLLEAFLTRDNNDKKTFILELIIGIVAIILGLCLLLINGFMEYALLVLGVLMVVYSIVLVVQIKTLNS